MSNSVNSRILVPPPELKAPSYRPSDQKTKNYVSDNKSPLAFLVFRVKN